MKKLLIVEPVEYMCSALKEALEKEYEVYTCAEGHVALEQINKLRPDALIINFFLSYMDGLTVLKQAAYTPPVILAVTCLVNPYIQHAAGLVGVQYIMVMPCPVSAIVERFRKLAEAPEFTHITMDQQTLTSSVLQNLGLSCYMAGYDMLCMAVPMFIKDPHLSFSKELYPAIADLLGNTRTCQAIEHAIRSTIHTAWEDRDPDLWRAFFPKDDKPPTNKQFVAVIASKIK